MELISADGSPYNTQLPRVSLEGIMFSLLNKLNMSREQNKDYKPVKLGFTDLSRSYLGAPFLNILLFFMKKLTNKVSAITSCGTFFFCHILKLEGDQ